MKAQTQGQKVLYAPLPYTLLSTAPVEGFTPPPEISLPSSRQPRISESTQMGLAPLVAPLSTQPCLQVFFDQLVSVPSHTLCSITTQLFPAKGLLE